MYMITSTNALNPETQVIKTGLETLQEAYKYLTALGNNGVPGTRYDVAPQVVETNYLLCMGCLQHIDPEKWAEHNHKNN